MTPRRIFHEHLFEFLLWVSCSWVWLVVHSLEEQVWVTFRLFVRVCAALLGHSQELEYPAHIILQTPWAPPDQSKLSLSEPLYNLVRHPHPALLAVSLSSASMSPSCTEILSSHGLGQQWCYTQTAQRKPLTSDTHPMYRWNHHTEVY